MHFGLELKAVNKSNINSYVFFALELNGSDYTRTALAGITREINKLFPMPALILFRHGESLTLSIINRRRHKREDSEDVLERVTLIQGIQCMTPHRAHVEILFDLSLGALHDKHGFSNFDGLQEAWRKTLDTSALNKRFFQDLANWYFWALGNSQFPKHAPKDAQGRDSLSLIRLITRIIFCWFLKEKGLLPDALFDERKAMALLNDPDREHSGYYKAILQNLFFATLNQEMKEREFRKDNQHFMAHNLYRYRSLLNNPDEALKLFSGLETAPSGPPSPFGPPPFPKGEPDGVSSGGADDSQSNPHDLPPTPSLERRGSGGEFGGGVRRGSSRGSSLASVISSPTTTSRTSSRPLKWTG